MKSLFVAGFALLLALSAQAQDCPECHKLNTKDSTLKWDTPAENLNSIVTKFSGAGGLLSYTAPRVSQETIDQSSNSTPQDLRGPVLNVPPPVFQTSYWNGNTGFINSATAPWNVYMPTAQAFRMSSMALNMRV